MKAIDEALASRRGVMPPVMVKVTGIFIGLFDAPLALIVTEP